MMAVVFPSKDDLTGNTTQGKYKTALNQFLDFVAQYTNEDGSAIGSSTIANTPSGNVTSTDLQGVVNEFDGRIGVNPSFRNKIINGNFDIWQRGTSQTSVGYASDDRWYNDNIGSTKTHSRQSFTPGQTDVPGTPLFFSRTIVSNVPGVNNKVSKLQNIEFAQTLAGKTITVSFYAKADTSKNIAVEFQQSFGTGGSPSTNVTGIGVTTIALTASWKKYVVTTNIPSISGKTLGTNNDSVTQLIFWFDAGSNYNSRTNSLGQQSGTFDIALVQLEEGSVATPFEQRPIGLELILCQRYYCPVSWSLTSPTIGTLASTITFPVWMRTTPTTTNISAGGVSNMNSILVSALGNGYVQVQAYCTASGGYISWRTDAFNAEL